MQFIPANLVQISLYAKRTNKVYLITNSTSKDELLNRAKITAQKFKIQLEVIHLEDSNLNVQTDKPKNRIPKIAIAKLFLANIIPKESTILYLDVDCMIRQPIDDLLTFKFATPVAAVEEVSRNSLKFPLENKISTYFNTGVMLISLDAFRTPEIKMKIKRLLEDKETTELLTSRFMDQDIFNYLFSESVTLLPRRFNQFAKNANNRRLIPFIQDVAILHFSGLEKPWKYPRRSKFTKEWLRTFETGVSSNGQVNDLKILNSRKGILNLSKFLNPLHFRLLLFYEEMISKVPRRIKHIIRSF
jgi:lipopolysaccharide biosynthesis glycosyltransferase